jgi:hypothetical protein
MVKRMMMNSNSNLLKPPQNCGDYGAGYGYSAPDYNFSGGTSICNSSSQVFRPTNQSYAQMWFNSVGQSKTWG